MRNTYDSSFRQCLNRPAKDPVAPPAHALLGHLDPRRPFVDSVGPWASADEERRAIDAAVSEHTKPLQFDYAGESEGGYIDSPNYFRRYWYKEV